ncbi:MAG TPA: PLD nuclease N-terminal domain-containing protein [Microlunatus sp.]
MSGHARGRSLDAQPAGRRRPGLRQPAERVAPAGAMAGLEEDVPMARKNWNELTGPQQAGFGLLGVVQLGLLVAAQIDLTRRTDEQVNGPKAVWRAVALINFVGPLAYFAVGRR